MRTVFEKRLSRVLLAVGLLVAVVAVPAVATPAGDDGSHTIEICHVSNSETNQFILMTVDVAAFDGEESNDHTHHTNKFHNWDHLPDPLIGCHATATTGPQD